MVQKHLEAQIEQAVAVLKLGGVVVFPTETAYALGADATNEAAVKRVFAIKKRGTEKTFPLIAADRSMVEQYAGIPHSFEKFVMKYWPGPLTLVLPVMGGLAPNVSRDGTIAIRVSSHTIARALSAELGAPIVSTSANLGGQPACYSIQDVHAQLRDKPDAFIDVGVLDRQPPSTIVAIDDYGYPEVIRQGAIHIA